MKRRDLVSGLALAGAVHAAAPPAEESLYIPQPHLVEDRKLLHDFMDEFSFVELVTSAPEIRITHLPVLLDRSAGPYGTLYGHISRHNPQGAAFDGRHAAVAVFRGPHSYISPTWYAKAEAVPTWNFAVVHAGGKLEAITEKKALHDLLARLIGKYEGSQKTAYDFAKLPDSYIYGMIEGIIGFKMTVERLEGKFKLGQDRSEADRAGLVRNLRAAPQATSMAEFTAAFYRRKPAADR